MESNDSPEISDREETSDIPGLPSGDRMKKWSIMDPKKVVFHDLKSGHITYSSFLKTPDIRAQIPMDDNSSIIMQESCYQLLAAFKTKMASLST